MSMYTHTHTHRRLSTGRGRTGADEETSHSQRLLKETSTEGQDIKKVVERGERYSVVPPSRKRDLSVSVCPLWSHATKKQPYQACISSRLACFYIINRWLLSQKPHHSHKHTHTHTQVHTHKHTHRRVTLELSVRESGPSAVPSSMDNPRVSKGF